MSRLNNFLPPVFLLLFIVVVAHEAGAQCSNVGNDFWTGFPDSYDTKDGIDGTPIRQWLYATPTFQNSTLVVETNYGTASYPLTVGQVTVVSIRSDYYQIGTGVDTKFIHAYTTDGTPFTLYSMSRQQYTTDAATCIPTYALGTRYRDASIPYSNTRFGHAEFMIVATQDSTTISIGGKNVSAQQFLLNKHETYQFTGRSATDSIDSIDIAGALITSDKPISVLSGNKCASLPASACDHVFEQLQPATSWGHVFNAVQLTQAGGSTTTQDVLRVVADQDQTQIYVKGVLKATKNKGQFYEFTLTGNAEIYASKPVEVAQFTSGPHTSAGQEGDPAMLIVTSINQYIPQTTFLVPTGQDSFLYNFIDVIVPTKFIDNVQLDGTPIAGALFQAIARTYAPVSYSAAHISITPGTHSLGWIMVPVDSEKNSIGAFQYGWARYDSYAYAPGFAAYSSPHIALADTAIRFDTLGCSTPFKDSVVKIYNVCYQDLKISGITIGGSGAGSFFVISPTTFPITVKEFDSLSCTIRYQPLASGASSADLLVASNDGNRDTVAISLSGVRDTLYYTLAPDTVDLGVVGVNKKSARDSVLFANPNPIPVRIADAHFASVFPGSIITWFPQILGSNNTFAIVIEGAPTDTGRFTAKVIVTIDSPCAAERSFIVTMYATGVSICPQADALHLKEPGQEALVPIVLQNSEKFRNASQVDVTVTYDADLLKISNDPIAPAYGTIENYSIAAAGGYLSFTLKLSSGQKFPSPDAVIATLRAGVLLAPRLQGEIRVISIITEGGNKIQSGSCPAGFTLNQSCIAISQLRSKGGGITSVFPNPTTSDATLALFSDTESDATLSVVDVFGRVLYEHAFHLVHGTQSLQFETSRYPSGVYFVKLSTDSWMASKAFNVQK